MSKLLKYHAVSSPEIKNQQGGKFDEKCGVRWRQAEKATIIIDNQKQDTFQVVSVCNFEGALLVLISSNNHET